MGCGVAHIVARLLAVRQARVRISARHPRGDPQTSGKQWGQQEWCSTSCIYKILYVCSINVKINKKEWQRATKPFFKTLKFSQCKCFYRNPKIQFLRTEKERTVWVSLRYNFNAITNTTHPRLLYISLPFEPRSTSSNSVLLHLNNTQTKGNKLLKALLLGKMRK